MPSAVFSHKQVTFSPHPALHSDVWARSNNPAPLQYCPAGQGWHCSSASRPVTAEKDPGGQGRGYPVPLGQKCPTGQMSLPGTPRPADSTCVRKKEKTEKERKNIIETKIGTKYYRDRFWKGYVWAESCKLSATETSSRHSWHTKVAQSVGCWAMAIWSLMPSFGRDLCTLQYNLQKRRSGQKLLAGSSMF